MKLNFAVAGEHVCAIEIWEERVPNLARAIREVEVRHRASRPRAVPVLIAARSARELRAARSSYL